MSSGGRRVLVTGVGAVTGAVAGGRDAVAGWLGRGSAPAATAPVDEALRGRIEAAEERRWSRVCRLAVAAAREALADAGLAGGEGLGLVIGTEFGDLTSSLEFVEGYLQRGPGGLSPLLFPGTVMNTMAAAATIAVGARGLSLTLNAPDIAGELAVARAAAAVRAGRVDAALAGGADEAVPLLREMLAHLGAGQSRRDEGAVFVVLEAEAAARARAARVLGEIRGVAWRAQAARPHGVGRGAEGRAVGAALREAGLAPDGLGRVYLSASGDAARDGWERRLLDAALAPARPPATALGAAGRHAGLGALAVAAAALQAAAGRPALVHGLARGGGHVALVVGAA
jgi:3-oxoacyl-[acyl-carrier-protein] synthase II